MGVFWQWMDRFFATPFPTGFFLFFAPWVLMLISGRGLIAWLKNLKGMKWSPREDTPDSHLAKAGVPSMGGIGIIGVALSTFSAFLVFVVVATILQRGLPGDWLEILAMGLFPLIVLAHALVGFGDDWSKARGTGGLRSRTKFLWQVGLAILFVGAAAWLSFRGDLGLPLLKLTDYGLILVLGLLVFGLVATSNAVNLTDGIDGLAAGLSLQCALALSWVVGTEWQSGDFRFEVFGCWLALGGACLGFLAFNKHPAKVFMGDTGSLALGAALGAGAILTRSVFLLPFIGLIFWAEMFSVIFQVLYFKWTKRTTGEGKRIFRRAPLHHHFELGGWSEWRVVGTFWLVNLVASVIGLVLWQMGILPRFP